MRTCQMDAMSSEVFDKALALGWIIRGIEKRNRKSLFSYDSEGFKATKFFHSAGLCLLHGRTWGLSTSKEGLFPVRDICSMAVQIRINREFWVPPGVSFICWGSVQMLQEYFLVDHLQSVAMSVGTECSGSIPSAGAGCCFCGSLLHTWHFTGSLGSIVSRDNIFFFPKSSVTDAEILVTHAFSLVLILIAKYHACI